LGPRYDEQAHMERLGLHGPWSVAPFLKTISQVV